MGFPAFLSKHRGANRAEAATSEMMDIVDHGDFYYVWNRIILIAYWLENTKIKHSLNSIEFRENFYCYALRLSYGSLEAFNRLQSLNSQHSCSSSCEALVASQERALLVFIYYALRLSCASLEAFNRLQSLNSQHSCSSCVRNERCSFYPHSGCGVSLK